MIPWVDRVREIGESLWRHPVRTVLTTLSVAWGTFVLVALLGLGEGLQNNVRYQFRDDATNSVWIYRGETTKPYDGLPVGRQIRFYNEDFEALREHPRVEHATGRYYPRVGPVAYRDRSSAYDLRAVHPEHRYHENTIVVAGRFLHQRDLDERRKVAVIGDLVSEYLFRGADPLGEWINIGNVPFRVVGVFTDDGGDSERRMVYLPVNTAQAVFGGGNRELRQFMFVVGDATVAQADAFADDARLQLAATHHFDPDDRRALRVRNNVEQYERIRRILGLLEGFVWLIGIGTIAAGIVGVSNIMLVSVRERTAEFGLRKALGATPLSIVSDVVQEAVVLTGTSGYAGVVAGVLLLEGLRAWMPPNDYLREPTIALAPAAIATGLLIVFGALAGFVPAWRAARIEPVEALRS